MENSGCSGLSSASQSPSELLVSLALRSALKYAIGVWLQRRRRQKFELVGRVAALYLHPVKSCKGVSLQRAWGGRLGLRFEGVTDRHWMIVNKDWAFQTQRQEPRMVLINVNFHGDVIQLNAPGMETLELPKYPVIEKDMVHKCRVWMEHIDALDCGVKAAKWISRFLEKDGLRIVCSAADLRKRQLLNRQSEFPDDNLLQGDAVAFSDFGAYLVLSQASVAHLNEQLEKPVSFRNFRPNIALDGCRAFDEDNWEEICIGENMLMRCLHKCNRCSMTTVDLDNGIKDKMNEPLNTLKKYRSKLPDGRPKFGINTTVDNEGWIKVGDPVYIIRKN